MTIKQVFEEDAGILAQLSSLIVLSTSNCTSEVVVKIRSSSLEEDSLF